MKWLYPFFAVFILIFFVPAQTLLLEGIKIGGVKPDLGLILSYLIGVAWGRWKGLLGGALLGGLQDFFSVGHLGLHCILKGTIGFGTGLLETVFLYFSLQAHAFVIFFLSLLHDLMGELLLHGANRGLMATVFTMVWRGLYNCFLTMVILFVFLKQTDPREYPIKKISR